MFVRRRAIENLVRWIWRSGPDPLSWILSLLYGGLMDVRNAVWTLGLAQASASRVPVISIGGLTLGGSGKTPITASLARHLADAGLSVAVLTPGQTDELEVHAARNPDVPVAGGRNRALLADRAATSGAEVVLLDSGFQHRRLARDLDIVTILVDNCGQLRRLPAGPARERWAALDRAHSVVLVRRQSPVAAGKRLERSIREAFPHIHISHVSICAVGIEAVSGGARAIAEPDPELAVAGVMWPELFFADVGRAGLLPAHQLSLADHATPDDQTVALMTRLAGPSGIVCTTKDAARLSSVLPDSIPIWRIEESVTWGDGGEDMQAGLEWLVRQDSRGSHYAA